MYGKITFGSPDNRETLSCAVSRGSIHIWHALYPADAFQEYCDDTIGYKSMNYISYDSNKVWKSIIVEVS